jgi:parallel beta-helix repeat protein
MKIVIQFAMRFVFPLFCASAAFGQGNLTPPGAPAPTMKSLDQIEPRIPVQSLGSGSFNLYVITNAGSYYLTTNIVGQALVNGIGIRANNVTLDLNGFTLIGVPSSRRGIMVGTDIPEAHTNIVVRNGTITGWGQDGLAASSTENSKFERLRISHSGGGILAGRHNLITDCTAEANGGYGISVAEGTTIIGCTADVNGITGIGAGSGCTITSCTTRSNRFNYGILVSDACTITDCTATRNGLRGIVTAQGCTLNGCTAAENISDGFGLGQGAVVNNCVAHFNGGVGIQSEEDGIIVSGATTRYNLGGGISLMGGSTVRNCLALANPTNGISVGGGSLVIACTVMNNSSTGIVATTGCTVKDCTVTTNGLVGISVADTTTVSGCTVSANTNHGILAGTNCTVSACAASYNGGDGIRLQNNCTALNNTASRNAGSGIYIAGGGNRVEGNNSLFNAQNGVGANGTANLILRNSARGNGPTTNLNFNIVAGNKVVVVHAPDSGAFFGDSGGAGVGTTDPWANFSY